MTSVRTKVKPPTNLSSTVSVVGGFAINLAWTANASAWPLSYYVIYRSSSEDAEPQLIEFVTGINAVTYRDDTVIEGVDYQYAVSTVNVHDVEGDVGNTTTTSVPSYPVWQTGWSLSIKQNLTESIATRATDPDGGSLTFSRVGGTAPVGVTVSSAGLVAVGSSAGGTSTLIIRANDGLLTSDTTVNITVEVVTTAPGTPGNFTATVFSATQINLFWQAGSGQAPTAYELDRSLTGTGGWQTIVSRTPASLATSYNDTGLAETTQYFYRVWAFNGTTSSLAAATANATTQSSPSGLNIPNLAGGPVWPHGLGGAGSSQSVVQTAKDQWEAWMGHSTDLYATWATETINTWTAFETVDAPKFNQCLQIFPNNIPLVFHWPMLPYLAGVRNDNFTNPGTWDTFANGGYDSHWVAFANTIVSKCNAVGRNPNTIIFAIGWEFNGGWYPWSLSTSKLQQWKDSWERMVGIIRQKIPTAIFTIQFARQQGGDARTLTASQMLPPASTWDTLDRSLHDNNGLVTSVATYNTYHLNNNGATNMGLQPILNLAVSHGKKFSFSEWSPQMVTVNANFPQSPNPEIFIGETKNFLDANSQHIAWDLYFGPSDRALHTRQGTAAAQVYKSRWA